MAEMVAIAQKCGIRALQAYYKEKATHASKLFRELHVPKSISDEQYIEILRHAREAGGEKGNMHAVAVAFKVSVCFECIHIRE
jgi:hypothetical protein